MLVADPVGEQGAVVLVGHAGVAQFALVEAGEFGGEAEEVGEVGQLQEVARRGEAVRRAVRLLVLGPRVEALGERAGEAVLVVVEPWQAGTPMVSRSLHVVSHRVASRPGHDSREDAPHPMDDRANSDRPGTDAAPSRPPGEPSTTIDRSRPLRQGFAVTSRSIAYRIDCLNDRFRPGGRPRPSGATQRADSPDGCDLRSTRGSAARPGAEPWRPRCGRLPPPPPRTRTNGCPRSTFPPPAPRTG